MKHQLMKILEWIVVAIAFLGIVFIAIVVYSILSDNSDFIYRK